MVVRPSGCGKSTLLRLVAGLDQPTKGDIEIFGKNAASLEPQDRDIGMVFQNYALFPHLSAFDNIAYGLKVRRESQPEIRKKVETVAKKLEISELLKRKPHQLSGGQRQRVALARLLSGILEFIYSMNHWATLTHSFVLACASNLPACTRKINEPLCM